MTETPRSNRPTPRTAAAVEAELKRRIRADLTQARADADGELDDASLASVIAVAIAAALSWHLESPEHARNATLSSRTWRPAGGPRGSARPGDSDDRPPFDERDDRPFGSRPPRPPYQERQERPPFQERGPRQYDDRGAPPRRESRDFDDRQFPSRGSQGRPPFSPRGGNRPSGGGGGFGPRRGGGGSRPPSGGRGGGGGGGFGPRRAPPRGR